MPVINFFEEDVPFKLTNKKKIREWLSRAIADEGFKLREISYIFCSDAYLLEINKQYLDHDTYTDIITFDHSEDERAVAGDIFISVERIRENATVYQSGEVNELHRVMIHGALHLLGYTDKTPADKKIMTGKEDEYLGKRNFTQER